MRLILKTQSRCIAFYWINLQKKAIVGWFAQDFVRRLLFIPDENNFDSHFTLPNDGNYHLSYKSKNPDKEEYITVYYDYVKIKTISNGSKFNTEVPRSEFQAENPYLATLIPEYHLDSFDTIKTFQFPVVAFNVYDGDIEIKKGERLIGRNSISKDDILVDVSLENNVNLNIYAMTRTKEYRDVFIQEAYKTYKKSLSLSNDRYLDLVCIMNKIN